VHLCASAQAHLSAGHAAFCKEFPDAVTTALASKPVSTALREIAADFERLYGTAAVAALGERNSGAVAPLPQRRAGTPITWLNDRQRADQTAKTTAEAERAELHGDARGGGEGCGFHTADLTAAPAPDAGANARAPPVADASSNAGPTATSPVARAGLPPPAERTVSSDLAAPQRTERPPGTCPLSPRWAFAGNGLACRALTR
jgi:hypothetical protein